MQPTSIKPKCIAGFAALLTGVAFFLPASAVAKNQTAVYENLELEKVIIFSRHGLRAPEEEEQAQALKKFTPYEWTQPDLKAGYLTPKGIRLETYFGQYLNQWLVKHRLLKERQCVDEQEVLVYTNNTQRTMVTGQAIINGAFPGCRIRPIHRGINDKDDPFFEGEIRTDNKAFLKRAEKNIDLKEINKKLAHNYQMLAYLINYPQSEECLTRKNCTFYKEPGSIRIKKGKRPSIKSGDMRTAKNLVNALMLQYYEGLPSAKIANGHIDTPKEWTEINEIKDEYLTAVRGSPMIASHIAHPQLEFIRRELDSRRKITVLVGHDSNIVSLLSALGVKEYTLPGQYENVPIGGKIFFHIWKDRKTGERKVGAEYVYQSHKQLRQGEKLTLAAPPQHSVLEMSGCRVDRNGLCAYRDFIAMLDENARLPHNVN